jgi:dihydrofolate synthase / folylpolyglutamate synthase
MNQQKLLPGYDDVIAFLDGFTNYERRTDYESGPEALGLGRIGRLLELVGNPQDEVRIVHIAGTKGKGSTAHLCAELLAASGYRVGLYTSPHLVDVRERVRVAGAPLSREVFCEAFQELRPALESLRKHPEWSPATYFETLTALAFLAFRSAGVEAAVVEVGLGGCFDATNIVKPTVCGISPVSLDHAAQLGPTLEAIAGEKGGIIKCGVPVLIGHQTDRVEAVLRQIALQRGAPVRSLRDGEFSASMDRYDLARADQRQQIELSTWLGRHEDIRLPLHGQHQAANAALAAALAEAFLEREGREPLTTALIRRAWRRRPLDGRFQILEREPAWLILDGAHNPASIWALSETLRQRFPDTEPVLVVGAARDKDLATMLRLIAPLAGLVIATETDHERSAEASLVAALAREGGAKEVLIHPNPVNALEAARKNVPAGGLLCVTGSLYLVGRILQQREGGA